MSELVGFAVESAVFCDPAQADNAHTYLMSKRDANRCGDHSGTSQE